MPQHGQRAGSDDRQIDEERQGVRRLALDQQRHRIGADQPERRDKRSLPQGLRDGAAGSRRQQHEGDARWQKTIKLMCRVNGGKDGRRAGSGQGLRNVGRRCVAAVQRRLAAPDPFGSRRERDAEQRP